MLCGLELYAEVCVQRRGDMIVSTLCSFMDRLAAAVYNTSESSGVRVQTAQALQVSPFVYSVCFMY